MVCQMTCRYLAMFCQMMHQYLDIACQMTLRYLLMVYQVIRRYPTMGCHLTSQYPTMIYKVKRRCPATVYILEHSSVVVWLFKARYLIKCSSVTSVNVTARDGLFICLINFRSTDESRVRYYRGTYVLCVGRQGTLPTLCRIAPWETGRLPSPQ